MIYFLTYVNNSGNTITSQVYPLDANLKIKYTLEGKTFNYRKKLEGDLVFYNDTANGRYDYSTIKNVNSRCNIFTLEVYKECDLTTPYHTGKFKWVDGSVDEDRCQFTVAISQNIDQLTCIDINGDTEKNIVNIPDDYEVFLESGVLYDYETVTARRLVANSNINSIPTNGGVEDRPLVLADDRPLHPSPHSAPHNGKTWDVYQSTYVYVSGLTPNCIFDITTTFFRDVITTFDYNGTNTAPSVTAGEDEYENHGTITYGDIELTKWARPPQGALNWEEVHTYDPITDKNTITFNCRDYLTVGYNNYQFFMKLEDILNYMIVECNLTIESKFFFDPVNPVLDSAEYPTNPLNGLMLLQKSDAVNANATQRAPKALMTFNKLIGWLNAMFNTYYYIDGYTLHLEHLSYFENGGSYTGTPQVGINTLLPEYSKFTTGKNKYTFDQSNIVDREEFKFMEQFYIEFTGVPIYYTNCTERAERIETRSADGITTDIFMIFKSEEYQLSYDGFIMVQTYVKDDGTIWVQKEKSKLSEFSVTNAHLGWPNLHYNYWRHGRVLSPGIMNAEETTFLSTRKIRKQDPITVPLCCNEFDPEKYVKTQLGDGKVLEASEDLKTGKLTMTLGYD